MYDDILQKAHDLRMKMLQDDMVKPREVAPNMQEVRCKNCRKLLGHISGDYEIKCPRCKTVNVYLKKLDMTVRVDNSLN